MHGNKIHEEQLNNMGEEKRLTYFFDDIGQILEVTDELLERYADSIVQFRVLQAQMEEAMFEPIAPKHAMEKFVKAMEGDEDIGPVKSTKHIISLDLNEDAPIDEIDTCLWTSGGFMNDYDDEWYLANTRENLNLVFDKQKAGTILRQFVMRLISKAG